MNGYDNITPSTISDNINYDTSDYASNNMEIYEDEQKQEPDLNVPSVATHADLDYVYQRMANGQKIILLSKNEECLNTSMHCKGMNLVIIYTGLCKTRSSIMDLTSQGINNVIVYNPREISMMENLDVKYLLKIKLNSIDIGIQFTHVKGISERPLKNLNGMWLTLSKKWFIENMSSRTPRKIDEYSHAVYKEMSSTVISIIDDFVRNKQQLKFVILDIKDVFDQNANHNQSNVAFKISIYNYILNAGIEDCAIV